MIDVIFVRCILFFCAVMLDIYFIILRSLSPGLSPGKRCWEHNCTQKKPCKCLSLHTFSHIPGNAVSFFTQQNAECDPRY